jgi:hypothetical protein
MISWRSGGILFAGAGAAGLVIVSGPVAESWLKKLSLCEAPHTLEPQKATRVSLRSMLNASEAPSNERHRLDSRNPRRRRDLHRLVLRGPLGVSDGLPPRVAASPVSGITRSQWSDGCRGVQQCEADSSPLSAINCERARIR